MRAMSRPSSLMRCVQCSTRDGCTTRSCSFAPVFFTTCTGSHTGAELAAPTQRPRAYQILFQPGHAPLDALKTSVASSPYQVLVVPFTSTC